MKEILTKERYRQSYKTYSPYIENYLRNQEIEMLECPRQSPDLNPIENLWAELNRKLNKRTCQNKEVIT